MKKSVEDKEKNFNDRLENFKCILESRMKIFCEVVDCEVKLLQKQRENTRKWVKDELQKIKIEFESSTLIEEKDQGNSVKKENNEKEFIDVSSSSEEGEDSEENSGISPVHTTIDSPASPNSDIN